MDNRIRSPTCDSRHAIPANNSPTRIYGGFSFAHHDKEDTEMSRTKLALDVVQDLRNLADSLETLANATVGDAPEQAEAPVRTEAVNAPSDPPTPADKPMSLVELRAFVAERSTPENRPKIKALLNQHGVNKLTELPEDQYVALKREVEAL